MWRIALFLALLFLPGCVHHSGPYGHGYGHRSAPVIHSRGYAPHPWRHPPPRWHAAPHARWHGYSGWQRHGPPRWHGPAHSHRPYRHHHWR